MSDPPAGIELRREANVIVALLLSVAAVAIIPLLRLTAPGIESDIPKHAALAVDIVESGMSFSYSLWYPLVWIASGAGNPDISRGASVTLLTVLVVGKAAVIYTIARLHRADKWEAALIAFGLSFIGPLLDPNAPTDIYLGQISATVWHNSTNIMVAPFALAAYWAFLRCYRDPSFSAAGVVAVALTVCVMVKPNFPLAFIPVAGVAMLWALRLAKTRFVRALLLLGLAFTPPLLMLVIQYLVVYVGDFPRAVAVGSLGIAPLEVWSLFSDNLVLSIALSLGAAGFALAVLAIAKSFHPEVAIAAATVVVALLQAALLVEISEATGDVAASGNWFWGAYTSLMVLFVWLTLSLREMATASRSARHRSWALVALGGLSFHVVSGLYYALVVGTEAYGNY